jgi:3-hydroxyisobutyrate dehydrogenase
MSDTTNTTNTTSRQATVALIGLGAMGAGMAERLLDQGFAVDVWNRTSGPATRLAERGATAHATPGQAAARADVVLTMLPTGDAVKEIMLEGGTLGTLRSGAVWAQMGTIGIESTAALQSEVARARTDVAFVDAPVTGSREPARNGRLVILASGPDEARPMVEPVLEALGRLVWLGEAGAGSRMKLVLNTWLAFEIEAAAEVAALADSLGVAHAALREAVAGGALPSGVAMTKLAKMESGDYSPDFSLEWALKDLDLAAAAAGVEVVPVAGSIAERWRHLVAEGLGHLDVSAARMRLGTTQGSPSPTVADPVLVPSEHRGAGGDRVQSRQVSASAGPGSSLEHR